MQISNFHHHHHHHHHTHPHEVLFKGNVLVFPNVTKEHRGTYYCVATNVVSFLIIYDHGDAFDEDDFMNIYDYCNEVVKLPKLSDI